MSFDSASSDMEFVGHDSRGGARGAGQPVSGLTQTLSTSTTPSTFANPLLPVHYRIVAVGSPIHVRLTTSASPVNATVSDMYVPVGVPVLVRLGASSWETTGTPPVPVVYNQMSVRTNTGTGSVFVTPLRY